MRRRLKRFDLTDVSREEVMDRHAWSYTLAADEMVREGKIDESAARRLRPDPECAPLRARRSLHRAVERGGHLFDARDGFDGDRALVRCGPRHARVQDRPIRLLSRRGAPADRRRSCRRDSFTRLLDFRLVPAQRPRPADRARSRCSESTRSLVSVSAISRSRPCSTGRAAFLCRSTETGASSRSR